MPYSVLVVDDDPMLTKMLDTTLSEQDFEVTIAHTGHKATELVRQLNPDVIVLDLMMPEVDGWQVCREIRTFSQTPILVLSAVVDSQDVMRALDEGANDYLLKPAPLGVIHARLLRLVRQTRTDYGG